MTGAFHGDPAVKQDLRARLAGHLAAGTLHFGQTHWDGTSGSALGVSVQGTDVDAYAQAFGYPLPLVGLLDPLGVMIQGAEQRDAFTLGWIDRVAPGADLARVPVQLMVHMLETIDTHAAVDPLKAQAIALHRRDKDGGSVTRAEWSALRQAVADDHHAGEHDRRSGEDDRMLQASLALLDAAAWPAARGYTPLTTVFDRCVDLIGLEPDPDWSDADEAQRDAFFTAMEKELQPRIEAGETLDFMAIFMEREPELMQRTEAYGDRFQARISQTAQAVADTCLACFGQAPGR